MINSIPKMFWRMNDGLSGRTKWMKIMISSQTTPVKEAVLNATERKKKIVSIYLETNEIIEVITSQIEITLLWAFTSGNFIRGI